MDTYRRLYCRHVPNFNCVRKTSRLYMAKLGGYPDVKNPGWRNRSGSMRIVIAQFDPEQRYWWLGGTWVVGPLCKQLANDVAVLHSYAQVARGDGYIGMSGRITHFRKSSATCSG